MWIAFKMSGFGGLVVPERVVGRIPGGVLTPTTEDRCYHCRWVEADAVFESHEECVTFCNEANDHSGRAELLTSLSKAGSP